MYAHNPQRTTNIVFEDRQLIYLSVLFRAKTISQYIEFESIKIEKFLLSLLKNKTKQKQITP